MKKYKEYHVSRNSNPAFLLNHIGRNALELAKEGEGYLIYNLITAQVMCSFTLEAAVNYLGQKLIENWQIIERGLSVKQKIILIAEFSGFDVDFGSEPFQYLTEMVRFRNDIVHARPSSTFSNDIQDHQIDSDGFPKVSTIPALQTKWEQYCNIGIAEKWLKAVKDICSYLSENTECLNPIVFGDMIDTWACLDTKQ